MLLRKMPLYAGNAILGVFVLFFLWPFYWMLIGSVKNLKVALQIPPEWFPLKPTWENYTTLFQKFPVVHWLYNSLFISVVATLLVVATSSMAAYAFSKISFKGSKWLFAAMVASMTIPHTVLLIPLFQMMNSLNLINTLWGCCFR
ncbi:carbohydrate ABC transporter permease [Paenibacillus sp. CC-CFT747]|nr:carbohydrate ABC transporter permease [Paenibacillus sp. CC-CFT747]